MPKDNATKKLIGGATPDALVKGITPGERAKQTTANSPAQGERGRSEIAKGELNEQELDQVAGE